MQTSLQTGSPCPPPPGYFNGIQLTETAVVCVSVIAGKLGEILLQVTAGQIKAAIDRDPINLLRCFQRGEQGCRDPCGPCRYPEQVRVSPSFRKLVKGQRVSAVGWEAYRF